jgi:hypothetical protein
MSDRQQERRARRRRKHSERSSTRRLVVAGGLTAGATLAFSGVAQAAPVTYTVGTNADDSAVGDCASIANTDCSLRQALSIANGTADADTIVFNASLSGSFITLATGELPINEPVTITGLGASQLTLDGTGYSRLFNLDPNAPDDPVSISGLTLRSGNAGASNGGAIYNQGADLTISSSVITTSNATSVSTHGHGGGVYSSGGTLEIDSSTISGNRAYQAGGVGSYNGDLTITDSTVGGNYADGDPSDNGDRGYGGGVWTYGGTATITGSTIKDNVAAYDGGGIYAVNDSGTALTIQNSTIANNHAANDDAGGVYDNGSSNTLTVIDSTVAGNTAATDGGGLKAVNVDTTPVLENSIVSGNTSGSDPNTADLEATGYFDSYFSLIGVAGGYVNDVGGSVIGVPARLGPLTDNGGPTETRAPLCGSPAIDQGIVVNAITDDQRDETRPFEVTGYPDATGGDGSDMGSVEIHSSPGTICVTKSPSSKNFGDQTVGTSSASQTFTVTGIGPDDVHIASAALVGGGAAQFSKTSDTCSGTALGTNDTCTVGVSFAPGSTGAKSAQLQLTDDAIDAPQSLSVSGTGVAVPPSPVTPTTPTTTTKKKCKKKKKHKRSAQSAKKKCKKKKKK